MCKGTTTYHCIHGIHGISFIRRCDLFSFFRCLQLSFNGNHSIGQCMFRVITKQIWLWYHKTICLYNKLFFHNNLYNKLVMNQPYIFIPGLFNDTKGLEWSSLFGFLSQSTWQNMFVLTEYVGSIMSWMLTSQCLLY